MMTPRIWISLPSLPAASFACVSTTTAAAPSFDCTKVKPGGIEAMICKDNALSVIGRKLMDVFAAATKKAANEHPPVLRAEQRG